MAGPLTVAGIVGGSLTGALGVGVAVHDGNNPELFNKCAGVEYIVQPGDSWYGIADMASVSVNRVLELNDVSIETIIHPGNIACLPGAIEELASDADVESNNQTNDMPAKSNEDCKVSADLTSDGTVDGNDVRAFQIQFNNVMADDIVVDGVRGPQTNAAIKVLQEQVGTSVDCDWGVYSQNSYDATYSSVSEPNESSNEQIDNGCNPYHSSTDIVVCASIGQGDEPVQVYQRGDDGKMNLIDAAYGRSSRIDSDGTEGTEDCITPRNHVLLDKRAMQEKTESGLEYFIPFGDCGGGNGTGFHYYPNREQWNDSHGCIRLPHDFIRNTYALIKAGGQVELIVRDK